MRTDFQNMLVEQDESVVTLTMNRPDVLNAINTLMLEELTEAVEAAAHNDAIRCVVLAGAGQDRKSTRLNSSHDQISYAVFCLKKKKKNTIRCRDKRTYFAESTEAECDHRDRATSDNVKDMS